MRLRSGSAYAEQRPLPPLPHDALVKIFSLLPRGERAVTPGRVCRAWAAAARVARAAMPREGAARDVVLVRPRAIVGVACPCLPLWYVSELYHSGRFGKHEGLCMLDGALAHGHMDVLELLYERANERLAASPDPFTIAAALGPMRVLEFLHARGCRWSTRTCHTAAVRGRFAVLRWCRERGCPWDEATCSGAVQCGDLQILRWCREQGCPWDAATFSMAAWHGSMPILEYCLENGCPWNENSCSRAAERGQIAALKFLRQNGCPWDESTCSAAATGGFIDVLRWAVENGCPWDLKRTSESAAMRGHLAVVEFCCEQGAPLTAWLCCLAAANGHKDVLALLCRRGCPWDESTCEKAAQYRVSRGAPLGRRARLPGRRGAVPHVHALVRVPRVAADVAAAGAVAVVYVWGILCVAGRCKPIQVVFYLSAAGEGAFFGGRACLAMKSNHSRRPGITPLLVCFVSSNRGQAIIYQNTFHARSFWCSLPPKHTHAPYIRASIHAARYSRSTRAHAHKAADRRRKKRADPS